MPKNKLAWLYGVASDGLSRSATIVAVVVTKRASLKVPFPLDVDEIADATHYAPATVRQALTELTRGGWLERVRQALPDGPVFGRWTANGQSVRWVPRPALFRLRLP